MYCGTYGIAPQYYLDNANIDAISQCDVISQRCNSISNNLIFIPGKCSTLTNCQKKNGFYNLDAALRHSSDSASSLFIPSCSANGEYAPQQCHQSIQYCWCVNEDGSRIKGTIVSLFSKTSIDCLAKRNAIETTKTRRNRRVFARVFIINNSKK